jgi:hypothetical protein
MEIGECKKIRMVEMRKPTKICIQDESFLADLFSPRRKKIHLTMSLFAKAAGKSLVRIHPTIIGQPIDSAHFASRQAKQEPQSRTKAG